MKLLYASPVSATFELDNREVFFAKEPYDVICNGDVVLSGVKENVFTLFNLTPSTSYSVEALGQICSAITPSIQNQTLTVPGCDLQKVIDEAKENTLINVEAGEYHIASLVVKSNIVLHLKKGALLLASTNPVDYPEIPPYYGEECYGTWEGEAMTMKRSIIHAHHVENFTLVGEGVIDGQAQLSDWWIDYKKKTPRPHLVYFCHCQNIHMVGVTVKNSPQWTIHPFFSENCYFYDLHIENPKISPNTDGLNPQACKNVEIIGVDFSVGDDCIAIKSGKISLTQKYHKPCDGILIRNCRMRYGHGGVVLGSECSGGIINLTVERCYFDHTDRGLRIKTRRGRGKESIIDNVLFTDIVMDGVLTPLVMNMFYFCDPDGKTEYVWSKETLPVDDRTPYLGKFTFERIHAKNAECAAGYFYGLPEMRVEEINIIDSDFSFNPDAKEGTPAMMSFAEVCCKRGFIFKNVKRVNMNNVICVGHEGERVVCEGNDYLSDIGGNEND